MNEINTNNEIEVNKKYNSFGYFSIIYGFIFLFYDRINFVTETAYRSSVLGQAYAEPLLLRFINLIIALVLINSGYFLLKRKKECWYLYNYAFLCILYKYIYSLFFTPFASGNLLIQSLFHFAFAIYGLKFVNDNLFKNELSVKTKNKNSPFIFISFIAISTIIFYGYESMVPYKMDNDKSYRRMLSQSHVYRPADSCYFEADFRAILDSLKDEINEYSSIKIVQLDSFENPIYSEELSVFELYIISEWYHYNNQGVLERKVQENSSRKDLVNTYLYEYYENLKIKSQTEIKFRFTNYDTFHYHYEYAQKGKIVQKDSIDRFHHYNYRIHINDLGNIEKRQTMKGIYMGQDKLFSYNKNGLLIKIVSMDESNKIPKSVKIVNYNIRQDKISELIYRYKTETEEVQWKELIIFKRNQTSQ